MENQHRKISGYRELTVEEIELMNAVKGLGPVIEGVLFQVREHLAKQSSLAHDSAVKGDTRELDRMFQAESQRWLSMGKTDLQTGLMALTRSIAQPGFF